MVHAIMGGGKIFTNMIEDLTTNPYVRSLMWYQEFLMMQPTQAQLRALSKGDPIMCTAQDVCYTAWPSSSFNGTILLWSSKRGPDWNAQLIHRFKQLRSYIRTHNHERDQCGLDVFDHYHNTIKEKLRECTMRVATALARANTERHVSGWIIPCANHIRLAEAILDMSDIYTRLGGEVVEEIVNNTAYSQWLTTNKGKLAELVELGLAPYYAR